ncbi:MAG: accessory factor UbiK family protein [Alphaproteobacteria bacterium]|nr:accessory factor UbiK family protein [Alphaproteobacteria bacterium]NCQ88216.1 accessory factor UbiK family protein [Alphaproteobacteria bacterium]NCT05277.1 accessory factor UbiK family protein [Alphaproteobacteria bacterium]
MLKKTDILDDIAKVAGGAAGTLNSIRQQIKNDVKARVEEVAMRLDLVPREDLDRVEALLEKVIADQEDMAARLDALENTKDKKKK